MTEHMQSAPKKAHESEPELGDDNAHGQLQQHN